MDLKVDYVLPEIEAAIPLWQVVRDCLAGQQAVKKRGETYVPKPTGLDKEEADARYTSYLARGVFMNFTDRTLSGMVGAVFGKDAVATLPDELLMMHENVDGSAVTMDQQAKQVLSDVISIGRIGLLTDYPERQKPASRQEVQEGKVRPTIQVYLAEQIINYRYIMVDSLRVLGLVVLSEQYTKEDDGFKEEKAPQYRVLRLEDKKYTVTVYRKTDTGLVQHGGKLIPKKADGKPFDYIPFEFIGSDNNDGAVDSCPLLDMANLNVAHFRNSCDFEEMVYMLGQPTPVITGLTQEWVDNVLNGRIILGSQKALMLPEDCDAFLLQIDESQLALSAMEHKERQAVALGARLVQSASVQRTAKEAGMEEASEQSLLLSSAKNVNSGYKRALRSAALFAGAKVTDDIGYELNTDFDILRLDSAGRAQLLNEWQRGAVTFTEYRSILRRAGVATLDDEEATAELDAEAETMAARMGLDPKLQNNGNPADKNAPPDTPGSPIDRSRKARGQGAKNNGKRAGKKS